MNEQFTPGPWQRSGVRRKWRDVSSDQVLDSHAIGPDGDEVALVFYAPKWHVEQLANANLIAAAPELFEALFKLRGAVDGLLPGYAYLTECKANASAALAKALASPTAPQPKGAEGE